MTNVRRLATVAVLSLAFAAPSIGASFDAAAARKTCQERYADEQKSGTIPVGMSKSKYVSQCTNSLRRDFQLEQDLAAKSAGGAGAATSQVTGGANELTAAAGKPRAGQPATSKPSNVTTPAFTPKGH